MRINELRFAVDVEQGQKTGMFLDQRENVCMLRNLSRDARVLDGHCYTDCGASRPRAGAKDVTCVDTSATAVDMARQNARLTGGRPLPF